jgi:hypothetical protein
LAKANDESSQSSNKYVKFDKVCESIPEKVERWRRSTDVGNQSTINSSGPEANLYGSQISYHRAEGQNGNEFDDDSLISLTHITQITNQHFVYILLPRKRKIYVPTKLPRKTEGNGFAINLHF